MSLRIVSRDEHMLTATDRLTGGYQLGAIAFILALFLFVIHFQGDAESNIWLMLAAVGCVVAGAVGIGFGGTRKLIFDKTSGQIRDVAKRHLRTTQKHIAMQQVVGIAQAIRVSNRVQNRRNSNRTNRRPQTTAHVNYLLRMNDGTSVTLSSQSHRVRSGFNMLGSFMNTNQSSYSDIPPEVQTIADFLGVPVESDERGAVTAQVMASQNRFTPPGMR